METRIFVQKRNNPDQFNVYDIQGLDPDALETVKYTVFAEVNQDQVSEENPIPTAQVLEYLPGQYDQRADAAQQCLRLLGYPDCKVKSGYGYRYPVKVNPVEMREKDLGVLSFEAYEPNRALPETVSLTEQLYDASSLAMSKEDFFFIKNYFDSLGRRPTETELRVIDTYWSDHCRHTTFETELIQVTFTGRYRKILEDEWQKFLQERKSARPITLMDLATLAARREELPDQEKSSEINACSIYTTVNGERYILQFKNETHNHPTEIEPFGGASTCIGGAIRDPLSGRTYVYQAMRISGSHDPVNDQEITGKLSSKEITQKAAHGYSSYGNQIGLTTTFVDEIYDPGYRAKRLELGFVVGAAKAEHIIREEPEPGDLVLLLGGRTGRDGIGGATGSSKTHTASSAETCGAEVQKGNAIIERKLQRLFRRGEVAKKIRKCNDFGAGGVSVAIGELARGIEINLDAVPVKYTGLNGTELAISESQERMAVVIRPEDEDFFMDRCAQEDVEATRVAVIADHDHLVMNYLGQKIVDIERSFLDTNGVRGQAEAEVELDVSLNRDFPFTSDSADTSNLPASQDGLGVKEKNGPAAGSQDAPAAESEDEGALETYLDTPEATYKNRPEIAGKNTAQAGGEGEVPINPAAGLAADRALKDPALKESASAISAPERFAQVLSHKNICSKRGLNEIFDSSIGTSTVFLPFGGKYLKTPAQVSAQLIHADPGDWPAPESADSVAAQESPKKAAQGEQNIAPGGQNAGQTDSTAQANAALGWAPVSDVASVAAYGFQVEVANQSPYHSGLISVVQSIAKLAAAGLDYRKLYFSFQEYFQRLGKDKRNWGKVVASLLGANQVLRHFHHAAIGGKDSMSGTFEDRHVPPTLVSFAIGVAPKQTLRSPEFKAIDSRLYLLAPALDQTGAPNLDSFEACLNLLEKIKPLSAYALGYGGIAAAAAKMSFGNRIGFRITTDQDLYQSRYGAFLLEVPAAAALSSVAPLDAPSALPAAKTSSPILLQIGETCPEDCSAVNGQPLDLRALEAVWEAPLAEIFPLAGKPETFETEFSPAAGLKPKQQLEIATRPKVFLPVFAGTNCEYDMARAFGQEGAQPITQVFRDLPSLVQQIEQAQILGLSGGFSLADEPEGSAKFIAAVLREPQVKQAVDQLLGRGGLILGICNGFQALIKSGLLPWGEAGPLTREAPTLTFNDSAHHVAKIVRTRITSVASPWLSSFELGQEHDIAISHGEGRIMMTEVDFQRLWQAGQVATQYVGENPNGSTHLVEGLLDPSGQILGKMGHSERKGEGLYQNYPNEVGQNLFRNGVEYFKWM